MTDLSKLNQQELSKALNNKYGFDLDAKNLPTGSKIKNVTLTAGDSTINLNKLQGTHTLEHKNGKLLVDNNEFTSAEDIGTDSTVNLKVKEATKVKTKNYFNFDDIKDVSFAFNTTGELTSAQFSSSKPENKFSKYDKNGNKILDFEVIDPSKPSTIDIEKQPDNSFYSVYEGKDNGNVFDACARSFVVIDPSGNVNVDAECEADSDNDGNCCG